MLAIVTSVTVTTSVTTSVPAVSVGPVMVNWTWPVASVLPMISSVMMTPDCALLESVVNVRTFLYLTFWSALATLPDVAAPPSFT